MPARKADLKIIIEYKGRRFSLNCVEGLWGKLYVKRGRSWSKKTTRSDVNKSVRGGS
jgi:hypothetical protein